MKLRFNLSLVIITALILRLLVLFISSYHPDLLNHLDWGNRFWSYGPKVFYEGNFWNVSWPNQPYGSIALFGLLSKLNQIIFSLVWYINVSVPAFPSAITTLLEKNLHIWLVKLPFILADIALGNLIYQIVRKYFPSKALFASSIFLFNPIVIYNSTVWGQTDSLINYLSLLGFWLTFNNSLLLGPFVFLSSYLFKLSLIIYLPIFAILLFYKRQYCPKILISIVAFLIFAYLFAIPFTPDRPVIDWIRYMYTNRVLPRQGQMLNGNAYNLWYLLTGFDYGASELQQFFGRTAKSIGQFAAIISFIPIYLGLFFKKPASISTYLYGLLLSAFGAFMFLTNIHERYLYPIFPILSIFLFFLPKVFSFRSFIILTLIHLLNLYNLWFYPNLPLIPQILVSNDFIVGRLFSLVLFAFYAYFYVQYFSEIRRQK